ncbi:MAG: portal protein, partial [Candidatus Heimdallarchaeaceae archaeon]
TEQDHIRDGYLMNQLQVINKTEMTALEVRTRMTENMRVLGPTFGRLMTEFMDVLLNRVISILQRSTDRFGLPRIPEAPEEIEGKEFLLIYTSPLARAQKQSYLQSTMIIVNTAIEWSRSTERPEILDNVNFDEAIKFVADASGDPVGVMRTDDQVQEIRVQRAELQRAQQELQMQQMQMQQVQQGAQIAESAAGAQEKQAKAKSYEQ